MRVLTSFTQLADVFAHLSVAYPLAVQSGKIAAAKAIKAKVDELYGDESKLTPIATATAESRSDGGAGGPLFIDGALLKNSVRIEHPDAETALIGSDQIIHLYHEMGYYNVRAGKMVPARPVFHIAAAESEPIVAAILGGELEAVVATVIGS